MKDGDAQATTVRAAALCFFWMSAVLSFGFTTFGYVRSEVKGAFGIYGSAMETLWVRAFVFCSFWLVVVGIISALFALTTRVRRLWLAFSLTAGVLTLLQLWARMDLQVFRLFQRHLAWEDLQILTSSAPLTHMGLNEQSIRRASRILLMAALSPPMLAAISYGVARWVWRPRWCGSVRWRVLVLVLILVAGVDRVIYTCLVFRNDTLVVRLPEMVPFYPDWGVRHAREARCGRAAEKRAFETRVNQLLSVHAATESIRPFRFPECPALSKPLPNILMVLIDTGAERFIDDQTMPHLMAFRQDKIVARQHYAAANTTHQSLFGLLSAQAPVQYAEWRAAGREPDACQLLARLGYRLRMASPYFLTFEGLDKFVFRRFETAPLAMNSRTDENVLAVVEHWLSEPGPQFLLMGINAPHYPYTTTKQVFAPSAPRMFITEWKPDALWTHRAEIVNRYRNSLCYADNLIGRLLPKVDLTNTIVIITADHGEEFYEHGRFGHMTAFTDEQVRVPFILSAPGHTGREIHTLTSHFDLIPTLLDLLGVKLAPQTCCLGQSVISDPPRSGLLTAMGTWMGANPNSFRWAAITDSFKVDFNFSRNRKFRLNAIFNRRDEPLEKFLDHPGMEAAIQATADACAQLLRCHTD